MSQNDAGPRLVAIAGMHRSGTSLIAGVVERLGVSFGDPDQLMQPGPDNPRGYWENRALKELNDELLATLGGSWDRPPPLEPGWEGSSELDGYRSRATVLLGEAFAASPPDSVIAFKDPRLSLLLPFWRTVRPLDVVLVVVRDPQAVIGSLAARNAMSAPQAALLWLRYLLAATADDASVVIHQRGLFDDLEGQVARLATVLDLPAPASGVVDEVREHVDPALRHHDRPDQAQQGDPLVALAARVWNDGDLDLDAVSGAAREALALGWLRAPSDDRELTETRAELAKLEATMRKRVRVIRQLRARLDALTDATTTGPAS